MWELNTRGQGFPLSLGRHDREQRLAPPRIAKVELLREKSAQGASRSAQTSLWQTRGTAAACTAIAVPLTVSQWRVCPYINRKSLACDPSFARKAPVVRMAVYQWQTGLWISREPLILAHMTFETRARLCSYSHLIIISQILAYLANSACSSRSDRLA